MVARVERSANRRWDEYLLGTAASIARHNAACRAVVARAPAAVRCRLPRASLRSSSARRSAQWSAGAARRQPRGEVPTRSAMCWRRTTTTRHTVMINTVCDIWRVSPWTWCTTSASVRQLTHRDGGRWSLVGSAAAVVRCATYIRWAHIRHPRSRVLHAASHRCSHNRAVISLNKARLPPLPRGSSATSGAVGYQRYRYEDNVHYALVKQDRRTARHRRYRGCSITSACRRVRRCPSPRVCCSSASPRSLEQASVVTDGANRATSAMTTRVHAD